MILNEITDFVQKLEAGQIERTMTNDTGLPKFVCDLFENLYHSHQEPKENEFSTTELLKGIKELILIRRHRSEIKSDVQDSAALVTGTAVHALMQAVAEINGLVCESPVLREVEIEGKTYVITGRFDFYDPETHTLYDLKDCKVAGFQKALRGEDDKWIKQLASYSNGLEELGYKVDKVVIIAILTDHSKVKASTDSSYPQGAISTISWSSDELSEHKAGIKDYQNERLAQIVKAMQLPDDDIEPCTPEERFEDAHFSVYEKTKGGDWKVRATRNFDTEEEAKEFAKTINGDTKIEFKNGTPIKCQLYCSCKDFCNFYQNYIKENQ